MLFKTLFACGLAAAAMAAEPCRIEIVERGTGWPVPLVELRTTHSMRFLSDNNGLIACDAPELMGREVWFDVVGNGYEVPKDGFGMRGVRLKPEAGKKLRIELDRKIIAKRLGRITGAGIFAESQKLGLEKDWIESGVFGCDSVQNAVHNGFMFWAWGDTTMPNYPLGIFDASSAMTAVQPIPEFKPPIRLKLDYFTDNRGRQRGVAPIPGSGPTWLSGYLSLPDKNGRSRLVSTYTKIKPPLEAYEVGLCVWHDEDQKFNRLKTIWSKSEKEPKAALFPDGHPSFWKDPDGKEWVLFGNPLPTLKCPVTFEAWQDPTKWEPLTPQKTIPSRDGKEVKPHTGHIAWSEFRKRWVTVFMEAYGKPSVFGELWFAEAESPLGPWKNAVKVLTHENYTFYNPRLHPEFTPTNSSVLIFEGTYTTDFADKPHPTPRYNYNQVLYRLDLDDEALN